MKYAPSSPNLALAKRMSPPLFPGRAKPRELACRLRHHYRCVGVAIYNRPSSLVAQPLDGERLYAPHLSRDRCGTRTGSPVSEISDLIDRTSRVVGRVSALVRSGRDNEPMCLRVPGREGSAISGFSPKWQGRISGKRRSRPFSTGREDRFSHRKSRSISTQSFRWVMVPSRRFGLEPGSSSQADSPLLIPACRGTLRTRRYARIWQNGNALFNLGIVKWPGKDGREWCRR
jgi:hypothetical protein